MIKLTAYSSRFKLYKLIARLYLCSPAIVVFISVCLNKLIQSLFDLRHFFDLRVRIAFAAGDHQGDLPQRC